MQLEEYLAALKAKANPFDQKTEEEIKLAYILHMAKKFQQEQQARQRAIQQQKSYESIEFTLKYTEVVVQERVEILTTRRKKYAKDRRGDRFDRDIQNPEQQYLYHVLQFEKTKNIYHARRATRLEKLINFKWRDITDAYEETDY